MASVRFEAVDKRYPNGQYGVRGIDLAIADGELLAVVGPSGCGKSTLLRLLAGLESPTAGHIRIADQVVDQWSPQARNVAMVFQDYALYPFMTVRGNLAFPLRMRRLAAPEIARRVALAADMLELGPVLDRYPRQLSGGQRQRVAMGRALVREPSVSLLDEPLSNLDAQLRGEVRTHIGALQARTGTTMLYVTHDQTEAMTLGQRIAVLDAGRLQQVAAPAELYAHPANRFVAGFIGSPPMNLLPAELVEEGATLLLVVAARRLALPEVLSARLRGAAGRVRCAGLRPEALTPAAAGDHATLSGAVAYVELLGHETLVHLSLDGTPLIARLAGLHHLSPGSVAHFAVDITRLHLFDGHGDAVV